MIKIPWVREITDQLLSQLKQTHLGEINLFYNQLNRVGK